MRRRCIVIVALLMMFSVGAGARGISPALAQISIRHAANGVAASAAGREPARSLIAATNPCDPDSDHDYDCYKASDPDRDSVPCDPDIDYDNDCIRQRDIDHDYGGYYCSSTQPLPTAPGQCGPRTGIRVGGAGHANARAGATGSYLPLSVPAPGNGSSTAAAGTQPVISGVAGGGGAAPITSLPATGGGAPSIPTSPGGSFGVLGLLMAAVGLAIRRLAGR